MCAIKTFKKSKVDTSCDCATRLCGCFNKLHGRINYALYLLVVDVWEKRSLRYVKSMIWMWVVGDGRKGGWSLCECLGYVEYLGAV